ncbi:hypothetical protein N7326_07910 [Corynebacterium sp. ES2794-CONJ1]|uniref:hypothetical protein n=1 Tax=unclassified Corynebacterium TaxID=2624378 RepID=UPI00216777BE|nr:MULTISPECIES: hypothetical protein [unclassified Corynebacterium]MCS4490489.1 hypothetical protein [Corynebacterium sp. ES2775-CONJ]MCS4492269.1 hypothetical protein [Corynebacterium sp. ES2715-CONJ3]MCS4532247.1 hypothetical protein [Corynebacterium sp. ES2730-CONJ]MCU9519788.1 hypothetical protein [Corynebacterium sp. ES2794-CONJ1]
MDHPENDLSSDADYANRFRPGAHSFDELADATDPLAEALRNRTSTRQAIYFALLTPLLTALVAYILAWVARWRGGPLCDGGEVVWICSRNAELWWPALTSVIPIVATLGCAVIMYRKYLGYTRWRPWMGTFWFLVPFSMIWMVTVFQMSIVGH